MKNPKAVTHLKARLVATHSMILRLSKDIDHDIGLLKELELREAELTHRIMEMEAGRSY